MIRKAIMGVAALGAMLVLRQVVGRMGERMRQRCAQVMSGPGGRGETLAGT